MLKNPSYVSKQLISDFIQTALKEDIGPGDYSSLASIDENATGTANLQIKEKGVLAGIEVALEVFKQLDANLNLEVYKKDGSSVEEGDIILAVNGKAQSILSAERLALNILQRMSGIATKTATLAKLIEHTNCKLLDTRKTTPNFRMFEKWAVYLGGGQNHRYALYDMIMLKDNHIDYAGTILNAVERTRAFLEVSNLDLKIEVETRTLEEVGEAIKADVDIILLDNMTNEMLKSAVRLVAGKCLTEASGGITEDSIVEIAETGVDFISVGALTHSYKSLDMSLKAKIK